MTDNLIKNPTLVINPDGDISCYSCLIPRFFKNSKIELTEAGGNLLIDILNTYIEHTYEEEFKKSDTLCLFMGMSHNIFNDALLDILQNGLVTVKRCEVYCIEKDKKTSVLIIKANMEEIFSLANSNDGADNE